MGEQQVDDLQPAALRSFMRSLLRDVQALDQMLSSNMIESGRRRIGCGQEMFLVDQAWRPSPVAIELLEHATVSLVILDVMLTRPHECYQLQC